MAAERLRSHAARAGRLAGRLFLSPADLSGPRAFCITALATGLMAALYAAATSSVLPGFRDTDDATRLEMVRELLAGRGWYDQMLTRFDPPHGLWMHWSRLLDGAIAAPMGILGLFMRPSDAEYWTRFFWPLLWMFPGVAAALALARNLGARSAVAIAALLLLVDTALYRQFYPGRIDHHDVQIVMTVIAMACVTARVDRARWALVAGAAAAFGLAVGLEALPMQALVGAAYGLALTRDQDEAGPARNYGLTLAAGSLALFLVQTPPARWGLSFCDALGVNLTAALMVAGLGLAITALLAGRTPARGRLALLGATGAAAAAVWVGAAPACLHGPFAGVDPEVKRFWLSRIQEVQPLNLMLGRSRAPAIAALVTGLFSLAAVVFLAWRERRAPRTATVLALVSTVVAFAIGWSAWRMQDYVFWIGLPATAAALSWVARRWLGERWAPTLLAAFLLAPSSIALAVTPLVAAVSGPIVIDRRKPPARPAPNAQPAGQVVAPPHASLAGIRGPIDHSPHCFQAATWAPLAVLPTGNVLGNQDFGPFIVIYTHDTAVVAPYHRLWPAILAAHRAFASPPKVAEGIVRSLRADYVVDCPPYNLPNDKGGLASELRQSRIPAWLRLVSAPQAALRIYKVTPAVTPRG